MNIATVLEMAADGMTDRVAVGDRDSGMTFGELRRRAARAGAAFAASGHERVAWLAEASEAFPVALFGAAWAGLAFAPLNHRLPAETVESLLDQLAPAVVVASDSCRDRAGAGPVVDSGALGAAGADGADRAATVGMGAVAILLFTSGTSGTPKTALLRHANILAYALGTVPFASAEPDEATLLAVPPFHIAGVSTVITSCLAGRRLVPLPRFSAEDWVATVEREAITHALVVPTMLARIVEILERRGPGALPTLRTLAYGGAKAPRPVVERALELLPQAGFVNAYGLTETSSTVALLGPDEHRSILTSDDPVVRRRLGSVGRPVPGVELEVRADDGTVLPSGATGNLWVRGEQVSGAYAGTETGAADWFPTGDLAAFDEAGYLFIEGRADDVIISGGENLSPGEIEETLVRHPCVAGAVVVGMPHQEWGERVAAMVVPRAGVQVDLDELRSYVRERLGSLKTPGEILLVDELPETDTGKVLRRAAKERLAAEGSG